MKKYSKLLFNIILFVFISIYPFLAVRTEFNSDFGNYAWSYGETHIFDFFLQFRAWTLVVIGAVAIPLTLLKVMEKMSKRDLMVLIISGVYILSISLSGLFSINKRASLVGIMGQHENVFVLISYVLIILLLYFYSPELKEYIEKRLFKWEIRILTIIVILLGLIQKGETYLMMSNPDYASIFVFILIAVEFYLFINNKNKDKYFDVLCMILLFVVQIKTRCTTNIVIMLFLCAIWGVFYFLKKDTTISLLIKAAFIVPVALVVLAIVYGATANTNPEFDIISIQTLEEGVKVVTKNGEYIFSNNEDASNKAMSYTRMMIPLDDREYDGFVIDGGYEKLAFVYNEEAGRYQQRTGYGKLMDLSEEKVAPFSNNYSFLGRGYIWGLSIPLVKNNILFGCGPDCYIYEVPHGDYAKSLNAGYLYQLITKPHSLYLQILIQTGAFALICFLALNGLAIWKYFSKKVIDINEFIIYSIIVGCLLTFVMNDSCVAVVPYYYIFLGIALSDDSCKINKKKL